MRILLISLVMLSGCFLDPSPRTSSGNTAPGGKDSGIGAYVAGSAGRRSHATGGYQGDDGAIVDLERDAAVDGGGAAGAPSLDDASSGDAADDPGSDVFADAGLGEPDAGGADADPVCCRYADAYHNGVDVCPNTIDQHTGKPYLCTCLVEGDDTDNDGILDCEDACPFEHKPEPRRCGCAVTSSTDPTC